MSRLNPFRLNRRSFLRGAGVAAALPYLECMASDKTSNMATLKRNGFRVGPAKRTAIIYVPNGVSLPGLDSEYKDWHWFPDSEGKNFRFTKVLESLEPHRNDLSILGGLSHPLSRNLMGHIAGDTFLTAGDLRNSYKNSISVDQVAARVKKHHSRYPSFTFSADGGVGFKSRVSTLSFDPQGNAIPSEHNHRQIFERYFVPSSDISSNKSNIISDERRKSLSRKQKIVDLILEDTKALQNRVSAHDKYKLERHLHALNSLEEQIQRNERWLDIPLKAFDEQKLNLAVDAKVDPQAYIRSMLDLIVLAFETDVTEVITYMLAREDGMGLGDAYPSLGLNIKKGHHQISHDKANGHWVEWGRYDQWLTTHFSYFLDRMKEAEDENGALIDSTQILYGSCCSTTHNARNYPLILAGGKSMGLTHGRYTKFEEKTPMSNLFVNMLNAAGIPAKQFADSTNDMSGFEHLFNHELDLA